MTAYFSSYESDFVSKMMYLDDTGKDFLFSRYVALGVFWCARYAKVEKITPCEVTLRFMEVPHDPKVIFWIYSYFLYNRI